MITRLDKAIDHMQPKPRATPRWYRAKGLIWLVPLALPIADLLGRRPEPAQLAVTFGAVMVFVAIFARIMVSSPFSRMRIGIPRRGGLESAVSVVVLVVISCGLTLWNGSAWLDMLVYTTAFTGVVLPERQATRVVLALAVVSFAFTRLYALDWNNTLGSVLMALSGGLITIGYGRLLSTVQELRAAREEIARLAVAQERLRIARDLHDLLGHSLSLIALKSELAVRLSPTAPDRAAAEIQDVESVARQALREMREAVTAYRQPSLTSELSGANELLSAAGIAFTYLGADASDTGLPPAAEATLAWAVREGVTNVIRHSRARHCTIRLSRDVDCIRLDVLDDGREAGGTLAGHEGQQRRGNGLAGLKERVAALGGQCEAGSHADAETEGGGFRLMVALPLNAAPASSETAPARAEEAEDAARQEVGVAR